MNWSETSVLVTGAASGIGRAVARTLVESGADLSLVDLSGEELADVRDELTGLSGEVKTFEADVTDADRMKSVVDQTRDVLGGPDIVVANAGLGYPTPADDFSLDRAKRLLDVNLNGVVNTVSPALDGMLESGSGHLVLVSSVAAFVNFKGGASYCASKAGVLRFAEGLRLDLREENVSVTTVHPGWVKTRMTEPYEERLRMFEISADDAAGHIKHGIEKNKRQVVFPWQARFLVGLMRFLPDAVIDYALSWAPGPEEYSKRPLKETNS